MTSPGSRCNRFSSNWVEQFDTCLGTETPPLTSELETQLSASDDVPSLLRALAAAGFETNADKLELFSRLCNVVLDSPNSREEFLTSGGLPIIVRYMVVNPEDVRSQTIAYRVIAVISGHNPAPVDAFVQCEVVEAIVDTINKFHTNEAFLRAAILTIKNLSSHESLRKYMQTPAVILSLLEVFKSVISEEYCLLSESLYVAALTSIISSLVFQSQLCRSIIGENQVVATILKAMTDHGSIEEVQYCCVLAIQNAVYQCQVNVACFLESDGLEKIFSSMATHPHSKLVLRHCLGAMLNVVMIDNEAKRNIIARKEFLAQLCAADCGDDLDIIKSKISIWVQLCEFDVSSDRTGVFNIASSFVETGSIPILSKYLGMACESSNSDMFLELCQLQSLLFLAGFFRQPKDKEDIAVFFEEIDVIMEALETFEREEKLIIPMLELLGGLLSGHDDCKNKFNEVSGVISIVSVMKHNRRNVKVNIACCKVLDIAAEGQLAMSVLLDGKEAVQSAVMTCMADFIDDATLTDRACSLLIKIAVHSKKDAAELVQAGARNMVQMAQVKHKGNPSVESLTNQLLVLLEDPGADGRPGQPSGPRGTAGQRMRSRSRTIEDPGSVRARANKSKSPVRAGQGKGGRVARDTRNQSVRTLRSNEDATEENQEDSGNNVSDRNISSRVRVRRAARQKMALEPVFEI